MVVAPSNRLGASSETTGRVAANTCSIVGEKAALRQIGTGFSSPVVATAAGHCLGLGQLVELPRV